MRFSVPLLRLLADKAGELRADRADAIVAGKLPDAEYRRQSGFIAGIDAVLEIAHEIDRQVDGEAPLERR